MAMPPRCWPGSSRPAAWPPSWRWDSPAGCQPAQIAPGKPVPMEPERLPADLAALLADCLDQRARGDLAGAARRAEAAWASVESGAPSALSRANTLLIRGLLAGDAGHHGAARCLLEEAA